MSLGVFQNEPHINWTNQVSIKDMRKALKKVKKTFGKVYPIMISGKAHHMPDSQRFNSYNPAKKEECVVGVTYEANRELVEHAGKVACSTGNVWTGLNAITRTEILLKAAEVVRRRKFILASYIIYEVGKSWSEAMAEVEEAIDFIELYARSILDYSGPALLQPWIHSERNSIEWIPRGTTAAICPWNFPIALAVEPIAASLAAGCPVLFKPAEQSPVCGFQVMKCFLDAGVPSGMIAYLPGHGTTGDMIVRSKHIAQVCFTGSKEVGDKVMVAAKSTPSLFGSKEAACEMGSNNPMILCETADVDQALKDWIQSAFSYGGEKCSKGQRGIIVTEDPEAPWVRTFEKRLLDAARSLNIGPTEDPQYQYGPLIDKKAYIDMNSRIDIFKPLTRDCVAGFRNDSTGWFIGPSIFIGLSHDHPFVRKEIFGPVLFIFYASTIKEAVTLANSSDYELLTAGIHTYLKSEQLYFMKNMRAGNKYVNKPIVGAIVGRQPFGHAAKIGLARRIEFFMKQEVVSIGFERHGTLIC